MEDCPTTLLDDKPSGSDFFGSHRRVAEAIAEMVQHEDGGRAVALEGTWGSGKSTVVKLLKSSLGDGDSQAETGVFVFDAWAHRGDPLRRSFLEKLVSQLEDWGWVEKGEWSEELDRLAERREDTTIKTTPLLTGWGAAILAAVLLAALGGQLLGLPENTSILGLSSDTLRTLGIIGVSLPAIVAAALYISWRPNLRFWTGDFWQDLSTWEYWSQHKDEHKNDSILSAFYHRVRERTEAQRVQTPDPTSIEFHEIFQQVVGGGLGKETDGRRLVIVIDNLDRVEAEEALTIWSTMRTFFEFQRYGREEWFRKFWLLVPFDKNSLRGLWASEIAESEEVGDDDRSEGNPVEAFLNKSFQVRFHVPPPVPSDWQEFFESQLAEALPAHDDPDQQYRVFRVFALTREEDRPTPREAILFINQVGSVHRQWNDEIPLALQALYIGKQRALEASIENLEEGDFIEDQLVRLIEEPDWQKYLAALHFNVPPKRAMQVWMEARVEEALLADSTEELEDVVELPGVPGVCEDTIERNMQGWATNEPASVAVAARNVAAVDDHLAPDMKRRIWTRFERATRTVEKWPKLDKKLGVGLATVVRNTREEELENVGSNLSRALSRSVPPFGDEDETWDPEDWIEGTLPVVSELVQRDINPTEHGFSVKTTTPVKYINSLRKLTKHDVPSQIRRVYQPEGYEVSELVDAFVGYIEEGRLISQDNGTVRLFSEIVGTEPMGPVSKAIAQRFNISAGGVDFDEIETAAEITLSLYGLGVVEKQHLDPVVSQQSHILSRFSQSVNQNHHNAAASLAILQLLFNPEGQFDSHVGQGQAGVEIFGACKTQDENRPELLNEIWTHCKKYDLLLPLIRDQNIRSEASSLLYTLVSKAIEEGRAAELIDTDTFVQSYIWFTRAVGPDEIKRLTSDVIDRAGLVDKLVEEGYRKERVALYRTVLECDLSKKARDEVNQLVGEGLSSIEDEEWAEHMSEETFTLGLVFDQLQREVNLTLTQQFREELERHVDKVMQDKAVPSRYRSNWTLLVEAIDEKMRDTFLRNVRDKILWQSNQAEGVVLYGDFYLREPEYLAEKADDVVRGLFTPVLDSDDAKAIRWVGRCIENAPGLLQRVDKSSLQDFKQRVVRRAADPGIEGDRREALTDLVNVLGMANELESAREAQVEGPSDEEE